MDRWLAKIDNLATWQVAIIIAVVGFAVFFTGLSNPFIGDDYGQIVNSVPVHSIKNISLFFEGGTFYNGQGLAPLIGVYYRPLMITLFSLVYSLFGPHVVYFHLFQLAFVIGSAFFLYLIFERLFNPLLALTLALVFLVHPMNSQVAFAIPTLQDALFFFFGVLAFWILIRFESVKSLWLVAACLFLSLMSKETGILFVAVSVLYLLWSNRERLRPFIGMLVLPSVAYLALKIHAVGLAGNPYIAPLAQIGLVGRLLTAPSIMLFYLSKFIFPFKLSSGYYWAYTNFTVRNVLLPLVIDIAVITLIVYLAYLIRRKVSAEQHVTFIFFALWCAIGLAPYSQVLPLDMTASETWFYFPMVGILGIIGILFVAFQDYIRPVMFIAVAAVICILGIRTVIRGTEWSSAYALSMHDVASSKNNYVAYYRLAEAYGQQGDFNQAKVYAQRSVDIFPTYTNYNDLGVASANLGDYAGAQHAYSSALRYSKYYLLYENLGELTLVYGKYNTNRQFLIDALQKFPGSANLWMYLAVLEEMNNDNTDAKVTITDASHHVQVNQIVYDRIMNNQPFVMNLNNIKANVNVP